MGSEVHKVHFDHKKHPGNEFEVLSLEEILYRKDLDHSPHHSHQINFYLLILIIEGEGKHTIDFKDYIYEKGTVLTIRKDQIHRFHPSSAKGHVLIFTEEFMVSYIEQTSARKIQEVFNELLFAQRTHLSNKELQEALVILDQITNEFRRTEDLHRSGIIRNLLQVLISKLHRIRNQDQVKPEHKYIPTFIELQQLIEQHCKESRAVQFYANKLNVTSKTLNNITHQVINKSPKTLIDEILTLRIKRALINSDLTIREIAYDSGFDEPTNLFKFFKKYTSQTPEAFRSSHATFGQG